MTKERNNMIVELMEEVRQKDAEIKHVKETSKDLDKQNNYHILVLKKNEKELLKRIEKKGKDVKNLSLFAWFGWGAFIASCCYIFLIR